MSARRALCGLAFCFALVGSNSFAADSNLLGPLATQWTNTRSMILRVAEVIPEDKYDYKPTPEVRSFREQLTHLIGENYLFMGMISGQKGPDPASYNNLKTRAEIVKALTESYDNGSKVIAGLDDQNAMEMVPMFGQQMPKWAVVMANMMDNMDHYGNLVVYMRLNGIVPPRTADRQKK